MLNRADSFRLRPSNSRRQRVFPLGSTARSASFRVPVARSGRQQTRVGSRFLSSARPTRLDSTSPSPRRLSISRDFAADLPVAIRSSLSFQGGRVFADPRGVPLVAAPVRQGIFQRLVALPSRVLNDPQGRPRLGFARGAATLGGPLSRTVGFVPNNPTLQLGTPEAPFRSGPLDLQGEFQFTGLDGAPFPGLPARFEAFSLGGLQNAIQAGDQRLGIAPSPFRPSSEVFGRAFPNSVEGLVRAGFTVDDRTVQNFGLFNLAAVGGF